MSERAKLEQEFLYKCRLRLSLADFIIAYGKLVEKCPHTKTHWIQEIHADGTFSDMLVKRCYRCGCNVDEMDVSHKFIEELLKTFDEACEKKRLEIKKDE